MMIGGQAPDIIFDGGDEEFFEFCNKYGWEYAYDAKNKVGVFANGIVFHVAKIIAGTSQSLSQCLLEIPKQRKNS